MGMQARQDNKNCFPRRLGARDVTVITAMFCTSLDLAYCSSKDGISTRCFVALNSCYHDP